MLRLKDIYGTCIFSHCDRIGSYCHLSFKFSNALSNYLYTSVCIVGYLMAFHSVSQIPEAKPVGMACAVWPGMGIVLVAIMAAVIYKELPDLSARIDMRLIVVRVIIMMFFFKMLPIKPMFRIKE